MSEQTVVEIKDMTTAQRELFDIYCDLEYALVNEYDHVPEEGISGHLKTAVGSWSQVLYNKGLLDTYLYNQAQKMASGDGSWGNE